MIDKDIIDQAQDLLIARDTDKVIELTKKVIADGHSPLELMDEAFIPAITEVGELFACGQMFLPELIFWKNSGLAESVCGCTTRLYPKPLNNLTADCFAALTHRLGKLCHKHPRARAQWS